MTDKAYAVPLHEQLASVPRDARLIIDDPDGRGTRFIPVGRMCHEAAEALRARLAQLEREWQGLTDEDWHEFMRDFLPDNRYGHTRMRAVWEFSQSKLKEKNS